MISVGSGTPDGGSRSPHPGPVSPSMEGKWMVNGERSASASDEQPTASPVIGVILILTITVVLGGLVGTFVLGLGDRSNRSPSTQFSIAFSDSGDGYRDEDDAITVTHERGDPVDPERIRVAVDGEDVEGVSGNWADPVTAGDTLTITEEPDPDHASVEQIDGDDRVLVVWKHPRIDRTIVLSEATGPAPGHPQTA